ncbi:MAG: hypothetical protein RBR74_11420, partial [Ignavibacteriaceae bacterium]|nr:hypothetical protein [Ignavibacteriaceae bacterium]
NSYKLYLNLSATLLHKVSRSRFLHITSLALLTLILLSTSCNTIEPQVNDNDLNKWKRISEFDGMDVKGFKIINDELYVYGWADNNGLYKTADGNSWTKINLPDTGNFHAGVSAITLLNGELIVASAYSFDGKYLCRISSGGQINVIPTQVPIEISDMEVLGSDLIIAPGRNYDQYNAGILKSNGELKFISNYLYTNPFVEGECSIGNAINPIYSSKLIKTNSNYLISGERAGPNFVTEIDTNGYHCFNYKGITTDDKFAGVYDLAWYRDTLFAATQSYIKFFVNDEWKVYMDSLPEVHGTVPFVTSFTFADNKVFVTTPSDGVLEWKDNKWNTLGDGLPQNKEQQIYPGISFIISFKNNLFIGFGTGKVWDTGMRGVWKYSLNN